MDAIVLTPDQDGETHQIELRGNLAATLHTNEEVAGIRRPLPASIFGRGGVQPAVLAAVDWGRMIALTAILSLFGRIVYRFAILLTPQC